MAFSLGELLFLTVKEENRSKVSFCSTLPFDSASFFFFLGDMARRHKNKKYDQ